MYCGALKTSRTKNHRNMFKPVLKLTLIIGPMWIVEVIGWAVANHGAELYEANWSALPFDVINSLHVIIINFNSFISTYL